MKIWVETSILISITALAAMTDIKYRKVFNMHLIVSLVIGFVIYMQFGSLNRISVYGFLLPFIIHYIPFKLRLVSAGDVKLFMLVGLFSSVKFVLSCMAISYILGGVVSLGIMVRHKCFKSKLRSIFVYFMNLMVNKKLVNYSSVGSERLAIPFALMIHFAVLMQVLCYQQV